MIKKKVLGNRFTKPEVVLTKNIQIHGEWCKAVPSLTAASTSACCHVGLRVCYRLQGHQSENLYFYSPHELKMAFPGVLKESRSFMDLSFSPPHEIS